MKMKKQISKLIKPNYEGKDLQSTSSNNIPLSIFDTLSFDTHVAIIYAFHPPTPSNTTIEKGLAKALAEYREWAGRLGEDTDGQPVILLNDKGARFVESAVDCTLEEYLMPFKPSSTLLTLHPPFPLEGGVEELVQVQLTRFTCGSLAVGFTAHHLVADGQATSNFLVAWGRATRGVHLGPLPTHDRTIFRPRDPPQIEFEHRGVEYEPMKKKPAVCADYDPDVIVHKTHYTKEFLMKLKSKASAGAPKPYSTFESLLAHLWRATTKARRLNASETTQIRISVNGRSRLGPGTVSDDYFGNLVLWAFPSSQVKSLVSEPIEYAARLIHEAIAKVDGDYFRSFIDFANSGAVEKEGLATTADMTKLVLCPNLEVDSWLRFPFYDLDFGGGCPDLFMPTYFPVEGMLYLVPSFVGDGSIDVYVPLHEKNMTTFKHICYNVD